MFDGYLGELMAIAVQFAVSLAAFLVEYEHFLAFYERRNDLAHDFRTFDGGSAHFHFAVVVYQQHFLKFNSLAALGTIDVVDEKLLAFFHFKLLTVNFYDCKHYLVVINGFFRGADCIAQPLTRPQRTLKRGKITTF